jgi:hypothetical protein
MLCYLRCRGPRKGGLPRDGRQAIDPSGHRAIGPSGDRFIESLVHRCFTQRVVPSCTSERAAPKAPPAPKPWRRAKRATDCGGVLTCCAPGYRMNSSPPRPFGPTETQPRRQSPPYGHAVACPYASASNGECPIQIDTSTPSWGNSRFGCWTCTVVDRDKASEGLLAPPFLARFALDKPTR